ncbi:MAG: hypothetical protein U0Y68_21905 [Blastocatellia bacterium]
MKTLSALFLKIDLPLRRTLLVAALFGLASSFAVQASLVTDPDLWWHLRTGQWIVTNKAVPLTDPFSSVGQGKPWIAYSWLFEVILYGFYQAWGLRGFIFYTGLLALCIALAWLVLLHKYTRRATATVGLTALALIGTAPMMTPRPWLFTILFFLLELALLLTARQSDRLRRLFWLPVIFALWANIHIQFIYGFLPLGLWFAEPWLQQCLQRPFARQNFRPAFSLWRAGIVVTCLGATLLTPYHLRVYLPVADFFRMPGAYQYVTELQAMGFRNLSHWTVLALALGAAYVWGKQRTLPPFPALLFLVGTLLAFRSSRDVWIGVSAAITVLATTRRTTDEADRLLLNTPQALVLALLIGLLPVVILQKRGISEATLQNELAKTFPVAAAQVVAERNYSGPLYNHFNWGGYLIWRLPQLPVSIDGRGNLYGDQAIQHSIKTWEGTPQWDKDTELAAARLVIADVNMPLAALLSRDSRFERVYQDAVAAVFIARTSPLPAK